jgi:hypothetical protein
MVTRRSARPLSSFLLRVTEQRSERINLHYELQELRSGRLHRFASLAALARFIAARQRVEQRNPGAAPAQRPPQRPPQRPRKRK